MAGLRGSSKAVLEGSLRLSGSTEFNVCGNSRAVPNKTGFVVRAQVSGEAETGRREMLGLVAAGIASSSFVKAVMAAAKAHQVEVYLQPLGQAQAAERAKESTKDILNVKPLIDKKAWPYVQNDLRLRAEYLGFDLNTVISAKPKDEKKSLKELTGKLFGTISNLDHVAKIKSTHEAEKYYAQTVSALNDVLSKLG